MYTTAQAESYKIEQDYQDDVDAGKIQGVVFLLLLVLMGVVNAFN